MDALRVYIDEQRLYDIADAIREANGEDTVYRPVDMPPAIREVKRSYESTIAELEAYIEQLERDGSSIDPDKNLVIDVVVDDDGILSFVLANQ